MYLGEIMTKSHEELVKFAEELGANLNGSNKRHDLVTRVARPSRRGKGLSRPGACYP